MTGFLEGEEDYIAELLRRADAQLDPYVERAVKLAGLDASQDHAPSTGEGAECSRPPKSACASPACIVEGRCMFPKPASITLPFPSSSLSGHAEGHWRSKSGPTKKHRGWAVVATRAAKLKFPATGDIRIHVRFVPPDRKGDRINFPNRMKPYFDGIAEALGVNDSRFVPSFEFAEPQKPGFVIVTVEAA